MIPDPWTQFVWNLDFLPESFSKLPQPLALREASKADFPGIQEVVRLSFSFDVAWSGSYRYWQDNLSRRITRCASKSSVPGLVIAHGNRIIAASVLDSDADSDHHLVTGPPFAKPAFPLLAATAVKPHPRQSSFTKSSVPPITRSTRIRSAGNPVGTERDTPRQSR
jgi:hypothetical protein